MQASEIAIIAPAEQPDPFVVTALGLRLHHEPTFDEWLKFGQKLWGLRTGLQWCVGDWLVYGEGRGDWGEMYAQAMDLTQYSYQTVANLIWVSGKIEISRRRELSWSHHEAVAKLSPVQQDALLTRAAKEKWSREDVREEVQRLLGKKTARQVFRAVFDANVSLEGEIYVKNLGAFVSVIESNVGVRATITLEYDEAEPPAVAESKAT